jgi:hypothetical protein
MLIFEKPGQHEVRYVGAEIICAQIKFQKFKYLVVPEAS